MPRYLLQDLLNVRQLREDAAQDAVTVARRKLEQAEQEVVRRRQELVDYIAWRKTREEELWQQILKKEIHLHDLDELKVDIQLLREKESFYEQKILEAEKAAGDAREGLKNAEAALRQASKDKRKLDEHKDMWQQEINREAEQAVDKEMEDFRTREIDEDDEDPGEPEA